MCYKKYRTTGERDFIDSCFQYSHSSIKSLFSPLGEKLGMPVKQSEPVNRDYFHDNWCPICDFMGFWIFLKKDVVALTFVKFEISS